MEIQARGQTSGGHAHPSDYDRAPGPPTVVARETSVSSRAIPAEHTAAQHLVVLVLVEPKHLVHAIDEVGAMFVLGTTVIKVGDAAALLTALDNADAVRLAPPQAPRCNRAS